MKINKIKCNKRLTIGTRCMQIEPFTIDRLPFTMGGQWSYLHYIIIITFFGFRFELSADRQKGQGKCV